MIEPVILQQMCDGSSFQQYINNFEFVKAVTCQYADVTGFLTLGLIVYGAVASSIYIRTNSLIIPFGMLMMFGGVALAQMASVAIPVAVMLVLVVPAAVTAVLYVRYGR